MKAYRPDAIQISPDRQRQEFDPVALEDLKSSIEGKRLQHAPVVRDGPDGPVLVAGERRLRVITDIFALGGSFWYDGVQYTETLPTVTLGELDPLEAEEAELDENLRRKDLTWQELANAHERLHKLRQAQRSVKAEETANLMEGPVTRPVQTVADTARELTGRSDGSYQDTIRKELIVSRHLHKPEVAKAKTLDEAFKILKRSEQAEQNRELAAKVGATFTADLHSAIHGNCLSVLDDMIAANKDFDVILTDPPYGMGADQFGDGGKDLPSHQYKDDHESWQVLMKAWAPRIFLVAKPEAHLYAFCDIDRFHELKGYLEAAGWYVFRTPLIDYKTDSGRVPLPDRGPRRQWEMILYAIKGNKPVTHIYPDVIPCQADENMTHGAQKPVALYVNLLKRSVKPGDLVLDTFAGSGTIFPAAHSLQCTATGIEQEANYYGMCLKRLQTMKEAVDPLAALVA
jgi:site-specific DNA-methyltransferase (adenine-specific)